MTYSAGVCNFCGTGCGHFLRSIDGRVVAVAPDVSHPVSRGRLCMRGWHIHELLATGARLMTPMVRRDGVLRPASYPEAIAVVRERLATLSDPAVEAGVVGSARSSNEDNFLLAKLARDVIGTSQTGVTSQSGHREAMRALGTAFGVAGPIGSLADIERARYILVVGGDLTRLNPIVGSNVHKAARGGSRVVALSSTGTQMARLATVHLAQRPGSERLAVNALLKAVVARRTSRPGFAERDLPGFPELERGLSQLSPDAIGAATGIPYSTFEAEARNLLEADSFLVLFPSGISGLDNETVNSVVNLAALGGKMAVPGSGILPIAGICNLQGSFDVGLICASEHADPLDRLGAAGSPIRALVVVDHDDGVIRHRNRIAGLDLVVYIGSFANPFTELAHVVLPTATFAENAGTYTASDGRVQLSPAQARPPVNVMPAWRLYREIAATAGHVWTYDSGADVFAEIAATIPAYRGMTHDALAAGFGRHCARPSGVRCQRVLPLDAVASAVPDAAFPFTLMIGKAQHFWHQHNLLRKTFIPRREYDATLLQYPRGYIEISPADARKLQVRDTWPVAVTSPHGTMKTAVKVSDAVQDGSACVPYFINEMITGFLAAHDPASAAGEDAIIPIRIEKL